MALVQLDAPASGPFVDGPIPEELLPGLTRDFTEKENVKVANEVHLTTAETGLAEPQCLWVLGPSAVGKSTITESKAQQLFDGEENAVLIDGAVLRDCHGGWKAVVEDGFCRPKPLIHKDAWDTMKNSGVLDRKKKEIIKKAIEGKMNLIIPEVGQKREKVQKMIDELDAAGYKQTLLCLWAPRHLVSERGSKRQCKEGKKFSMRGYIDSIKNCVHFAQYFIEKYGSGSCEILSTDKFPNMRLRVHELQKFATMAEENDVAEKSIHLVHRGAHAIEKQRAAIRIQSLMRGRRARFRVASIARRRSEQSLEAHLPPSANAPAAAATAATAALGQETVSPSRVRKGSAAASPAAPAGQSGAPALPERHPLRAVLDGLQQELNRAAALAVSCHLEAQSAPPGVAVYARADLAHALGVLAASAQKASREVKLGLTGSRGLGEASVSAAARALPPPPLHTLPPATACAWSSPQARAAHSSRRELLSPGAQPPTQGVSAFADPHGMHSPHR
eukprot:TRINITY_DN7686_c0_g1_i4.p1 TRINITY_DN7686_c0_g1~~TRINITY_DN7686_c0_g1_i4.p1  ORF type:complete len:535 (+),score=161.25 TRINITY_DN7686_c0_g1_i4:91-1605(+)